MYNINSNVLTKTGLIAAQLQSAADAIHPGNGFNAFQAFVDLETQYGINSLFALSHASQESGWGLSNIAKTKNNLFGFNAVDSDPGEAASYPSQAACINFYGQFLKIHYLTPGGIYYNGPTINSVFINYSSSHTIEATEIVDIMNDIYNHLSAGGNPVPAPVALPASSATNTLTIEPGNTFWSLEVEHNWPHGTLQSLNPGVSPTKLQIGEVIHCPGNSTLNTGTYVIKQGDTFWSLETEHGWPHGTLQGLNPTVNANDLQIGETINV